MSKQNVTEPENFLERWSKRKIAERDRLAADETTADQTTADKKTADDRASGDDQAQLPAHEGGCQDRSAEQR